MSMKLLAHYFLTIYIRGLDLYASAVLYQIPKVHK
jgi:hypothetical protein